MPKTIQKKNICTAEFCSVVYANEITVLVRSNSLLRFTKTTLLALENSTFSLIKQRTKMGRTLFYFLHFVWPVFTEFGQRKRPCHRQRRVCSRNHLHSRFLIFKSFLEDTVVFICPILTFFLVQKMERVRGWIGENGDGEILQGKLFFE
ncbi:hypothetical protein ABFS83_01G105700 [Erythranthe nasuta]